MGLVVTVIALALAAVVQSTVLPHLAILGNKLDLVLLLVVAWSIRRGVEGGLVWAVLGGMLVDALSAAPFGISVLAFGLAAVIAGSFGPSLRQASAFLPLLLTPLASIVATLSAAFILDALGWPISWPVTVALVVLPLAVLDSLAMVLVYPVVAAIDQRTQVVVD